MSKNSFQTESTFELGGKNYTYYDLGKLSKSGFDVSRLPFSFKILLENLLRQEDGINVTKADIEALAKVDLKKTSEKEISFMPARVILQDFTGVPAICDLAAMRDAMQTLGGDPKKINPLLPSELVIDHSVQVDHFGTENAFAQNTALEYDRNHERYVFLRWGQTAFSNFAVVPPETGIVHQVNIEHLARVVFTKSVGNKLLAYPDSVVGTDSHTTMVNGVGVLGWGVGGIEAEAAMLGQPTNFLIPPVVGFKLTGQLKAGITSTDLALTVTELLRKKGVVEKFVEFFGPGLSSLSVADRATLGNMSPEYGSTCAIFPIDSKTTDYLRLTGRSEEQVQLIETYAKLQGMYRNESDADPIFTDIVELDLSTVEPSLAGPKRPQDRVALSQVKNKFLEILPTLKPKGSKGKVSLTARNQKVEMDHGAVVIAAITSCTNTSNPALLMAAGLVAKKACERGLKVKPWVKTSLAPGSLVVESYLKSAGLLSYLNDLQFNIVGYGCTTCIGNSGPLPTEVSQAIKEGDLVAVSVLSGNRNFEGRINPDVRANYLASPPLVVAYALSGRIDWDPNAEPIGKDKNGKDVFLKDIWPTPDEINALTSQHVTSALFKTRYADVFKGDSRWQALETPKGDRYSWDLKSTYIRRPPYFDGMKAKPSSPADISGARVLATLGHSVTTDHISPAGSIKTDSPAGKYLIENGVKKEDFNAYGARRGNHEVMVRGTFANIRIKNGLTPTIEGGVTRHIPSNQVMPIYDAAVKYMSEHIPLIILAGKEYGSGSSRDWAAKGPNMQGIKAVIAESYERIHRSNLIGMGVLPLQYLSGQTRESLGLTGEETFSITGIATDLKPGKLLDVTATNTQGKTTTFQATCRINTPIELEYYRHGGILLYVLRQLL